MSTTITAGPATADGATTRILYPYKTLDFAADGTYTVRTIPTPATLYRASGLINATLDYNPVDRNEISYRVQPNDEFHTL